MIKHLYLRDANGQRIPFSRSDEMAYVDDLSEGQYADYVAGFRDDDLYYMEWVTYDPDTFERVRATGIPTRLVSREEWDTLPDEA
jgi:hypothetical protein